VSGQDVDVLENATGARAGMELSVPADLPLALAEPTPPTDTPLEPSVTEGKDAVTGRFLAHNRYGKGNPVSKQASRLRRALYAAVSPADLRDVVEKLVAQAKAGDTAASKILLTTLLGPPQSLDVLAIVAKLENVVFKGVRP